MKTRWADAGGGYRGEKKPQTTNTGGMVILMIDGIGILIDHHYAPI